jgi:hypothetical protein
MLTIVNILKHAVYLAWSTKAVASANRKWRARRPYKGDVLMTRDGFHAWLFRWAVDTGRVEDPGPLRRQPESAYVALAFDRDRQAVVDEARNYWRAKIEEHAG